MRSWVEIPPCRHSWVGNMSTSSWGRELKFLPAIIRGIRLLSTSSWGRELKCFSNCSLLFWGKGRPLREVVSWNIREYYRFDTLNVDLFVRSWVEILGLKRSTLTGIKSTSSWGRELKYHAEIHAVHVVKVDLFVRSWVEMTWLLQCAADHIVDLFVRSWVEMH